MTRRKGQLARIGISLVLAAILILAVGIPIVQDTVSTSTNSVTDEQDAASGSLPDSFTTDELGDGLEEGTIEVEHWNASGDGTNTSIDSSNFTVDLDTGNITINNASSSVTASLDSGDFWLATYNWKPEDYVEGTTLQTIIDNVPIIMALALLVASFGAVMRVS